jgi:predicted nucleic-acid-binding protein
MAKSAELLPDTNVVLRYLLRDIPEQFEAAAALFEQVRTGARKAVLLESVLVECVYILTKFYDVPRSEAAAALAGLLQYKGVVNRDKVALADALACYGAGTLDPVDCVLLAKARHGSQELFSFDKALQKAFAATTPGAGQGQAGS